MFLWMIRVFFVVGFSLIGYQIGSNLHRGILGLSIGAIAALVLILLEIFTRNISLRGLSSAVFGLLLGLLMARIIIKPFELFNLSPVTISYLNIIFTFSFAYLGVVLAMRGRDEFNIVIPYVKFKRQDVREESYLLDTSIIIDGRLEDIVKTGFIEGKLIVPRFILKELHKIADSTDHLKRQRGRRGIEMLNNLKKIQGIDLRIHEAEIENVKDTDAKLIKLAQLIDARVLTTDYNLNRVAELEGVKVLNINELANALKPVFLPGEKFSIKLIKEGKEYNQAVGYLDDGTMVVVENARNLIGRTIEVVVSSVLQTPAGRIIFTQPVS